MATDIDKALQEYADSIFNKIMEKAEQDLPVAMDYAVEELKRETTDMYNTLITQFYSYKTKSYIRHWEGRPGTMKGSNLYYAFVAKKRHSGNLPYLYISISGKGMAGGYQWDTPEGVLNSVLEGGRGPLMTPWSGYYSGKYFSYRGIPEDIFNSFFKNYETILTPIFMTKWRALGWE